MDGYFKVCTCCHKVWETQESFLCDPEVVLNGYSADFDDLEKGMFFFTHKADGCCSTVSMVVSNFFNLYKGAVYSERKTGTEGCPRYCLDKNQLERCNAFCECAYVREIANIIKNKKNLIT